MAEAHVLVGTAEAAASMFHTETVSREKRAHMPRSARPDMPKRGCSAGSLSTASNVFTCAGNTSSSEVADPVQPPREPTARATSSRDTRSAAVAWMAMSTFARLVSGIVSVGLKALELVTDR
jgi:hypothetical protein